MISYKTTFLLIRIKSYGQVKQTDLIIWKIHNYQYIFQNDNSKSITLFNDLNHYELFSLVNRNIREKNLTPINFMRVEVGL